MIFDVKKCFHAVGNGTLFTGQISGIGQNGSIFNWMYDCGSTSEKTVLKVVSNLPNWFGAANTIDILVISHFDDDHINGLEALLQSYYVKRLVLPFSEWPQKIREISVLGQRGITPSAALFQINPTRWLEVNDLTNKVGEILLVQGQGEDGERDYPFDEPSESEWPPLVDEAAAGFTFIDFGSPKLQGGIKVTRIHHNQPVYVSNNSFELMFYNAERSFASLGLIYESSGQRFSKKSRMPILSVKHDIEKTIISIGLDQGISGLPVDWRKTLKSCYEKHFGSTAKARNNISLCMYAAPRVEAICLAKSPATLFTGDINLTRDVIDDMQTHFGIDRWISLGLVQVPHHGSKYCWTAGNATRFNDAQFVQCATPTQHHPHMNVTADLNNNGCKVHHANRTTAVFGDYTYAHRLA